MNLYSIMSFKENNLFFTIFINYINKIEPVNLINFNLALNSPD